MSEALKNRKATIKKKRQNHLFIAIILSAVALLAVSLSVKLFFSKDCLKGVWDLDGNTLYSFDGRGNGCLLAGTDEYNFTYTVDEDKVYLDFESESAKDVGYTFTVQGDKLTLVRIGDIITGSFELTKK